MTRSRIDLVDDVAAVPGVAARRGLLQRYAQMLDQDGDPIGTNGAPALGLSWGGEDGTQRRRAQGRSRARRTPTRSRSTRRPPIESAIDVGDKISIVFDTGQRSFTIVGLVGLGDTDGFAGATTSLFDTRPPPRRS